MISGTISVAAFSQALSIPFDLAENCRLEFLDDSLYIPAIDKSQTANVDVYLETSAFNGYQTDGEVIGIEIKRLKQILKHSPKDGDINFYLEEESRRFILDIEGQKFNLSLVDISSIATTAIPSVEDVPIIRLQNSNFINSVEAANILSDDVDLRFDEEVFIIEAKGDKDSTTKRFSGEEITIENQGLGEATFSLDFLTILTDALPSDGEIRIHLPYERPALFEYNILNGNGTVEYLQAPRIKPES